MEYARGLGTAKSYGRGNSAMGPMYDACAEMKRSRLDVEYGFTPFNVLHLSPLNLASVAVVGLSAWACMQGEIPLWMFLAMAMFSFTIFGGVERVSDSAHMLGDLNDVLDRLEKIEAVLFIDEDGGEVELARRIGISGRRLWHVLNGQRELRVDEFLLLFIALNIDLCGFIARWWCCWASWRPTADAARRRGCSPASTASRPAPIAPPCARSAAFARV